MGISADADTSSVPRLNIDVILQTHPVAKHNRSTICILINQDSVIDEDVGAKVNGCMNGRTRRNEASRV